MGESNITNPNINNDVYTINPGIIKLFDTYIKNNKEVKQN